MFSQKGDKRFVKTDAEFTKHKVKEKDFHNSDGSVSLSDRSERSFWIIFAIVSSIKFLLIPTYHSTDFEVHRNWLSITHNLPINEWYTSSKSQWTLDYPPFFAWFEYFLSQFGSFFDPKMLEIDNLEYASFRTKIFQRSTVILTDLVYAYGVKEIAKTFYHGEKNFATFTLLALSNIGLLIVDHIHFQYNGFLLGILMLSISRVTRISNERQVLQGAFWFAVLLNLKHIYVYVAPAFVIWLLKSYCFKNGAKYFSKIFKLGIIVLFVLAMSFGPFIRQLPQVITRLFPFKRGLVHAYWASNAWALYTGFDKLLSIIWRRFNWSIRSGEASMTGGLVQEYVYSVLPTPTPFATFLITFAFMIPCLWILFTRSNFRSPKHFVRCVILCGLTSFMFGWHVHEKAILTAVIPLCVLATIDPQDAKIFIILSTSGHTALLPLLYELNLSPLRILLLSFYTILSITILNNLHNNERKNKTLLLNNYELLYIIILPLLPLYENFLHNLIFSNNNLPFLPLALFSLYCSIGISYSWIYYYLIYIRF